MELVDHEWPADQTEHKWGKWMALSGPPQSGFTQYRTCVHDGCNAHQERQAPN